MPGQERRRRAPGARGLRAAALAALAAGAASAHAADLRLDDSFRYETPEQAHHLRAAGLVLGYVGLQLGVYALTPRPANPRYDVVYTPSDKLFHGAISYDSNTFRTNFVGHPTMGTILYLMARGSRVPTWEASLWAVVGSTTWEFVEYHETASINDLIVTPLIGISVGEPLFQLGAHYDRGPASTAGTVLSWLVSPFKKLSDAYDGARLARGDPADRLSSRAIVGGVATAGGGSTSSGLRLGGGWRLVRDVDYGAPGTDTRSWLDGEVTALSLDATLGGGALSDGRFESSTLLAAVYSRDLDEAGRGGDLLAGAGIGYVLRQHLWEGTGPDDFAGLCQLPRVTLEGRWLAGDLRLIGRLGGAFLFGGARSFALDRAPAAVPPAELPTGQIEYGYHFGVGAGLYPAVEVAFGPASLGGGWRGDALWHTSQRPDPQPGHDPHAQLEERWSEATARLAWRFAGGLELSLDGTWRRRWSRADEVVRTASDRSLGVGVGWLGGR